MDTKAFFLCEGRPNLILWTGIEYQMFFLQTQPLSSFDNFEILLKN